MFVRVKTTPNSPRKSVQLVESVRVNGLVSQKIVKHIGIALDDAELVELKLLAESIKRKLELENILPIFTPEELELEIQTAHKIAKTTHYKDDDYILDIRNTIEENRAITGIHDVYGSLFDELSISSIFGKTKPNQKTIEMFKNIVLSRLAMPDSKRGSVTRLEENFGVSLHLNSVYKMMDKLDEKAIANLNSLAYQKTTELFGGKVDVIYFDATTLYFESFIEDEFKKNGYSKDLKFNQPQVVLALMVTEQGLPIGYETFSGDTFDGHTLIPSLEILRSKYDINNVTFVADSGMFNNKNLTELEKEPEKLDPEKPDDVEIKLQETTDELAILEKHKFNYIVGARIKNLTKDIKEQIVDMANYTEINSELKIARFTLPNGRKLIVTHSKTRAKKDKFEREKTITKLVKKLETSQSPKQQLSNNGASKYLTLTNKDGKTKCDMNITINEEKIIEAQMWDGLKGLIKNGDSTLSDETILAQYNNLWQVEESFRITKHDLKIRPIYHWKPQRIKAHIAISFTAYMLARHLEYRIRLQYKKLSPKVIRDLLLGVQTSINYDTVKKIKYAIPSKIKEETKKIYKIMGITRTLTPWIIGKL